MRASRLMTTGLATLALSLIASPAAQASVTYGPLTSFGAGQVGGPLGVSVDQASNDVYVASFFSTHKLNKFSASGSIIKPPSPFGQGLSFFGDEFFSGVAVDPLNGHLYVVDGLGQAIQSYDGSTGYLLSHFSVAGSGNLFGGFLTAVQIASDSTGNIYFPNAPSNEVQEFGPSGSVLATIIGSGASALKEPTGVALDAAGNIYVADTGNGRVEQFSPTGVFVRAIASPGAQAVAVDGAGNVYVGENSGSGFHVVVYDPSANQLADFGMGTIGTSEFGAINTLAVGPTGWVYVTDGGNNVVWIYAQQREPSLVNVSTSAVTQTSATLNATINPGYADTTYHFEYGTSSSYGASVPVLDADIGNGLGGPVVVGQEISGLQPGTTYHYRVIATNAIGQTIGADQTFTTPPLQPPVVSTGQASGVAQNTATLSGAIDTRGFQTTYEFDLGTDTSYGTRIFGDAGSQPGSQAFTVSLQGLAPASAYHYRIVASNIFGTSYGADQAFTTSSYPSSTLTAPAPPALVPAPPIVSATTSAGAASAKPAVARSARHAKAKKSKRRPGRHKQAKKKGRGKK
jgi:NHL repeat